MKIQFIKTLIICATGMLLLAGCASMGGGSGVDILVSGQHANIKDQQYTDIHNQADFDAMWQKAFDNLSFVPTKPVVDFSKHMIIAAFAGEQTTSGWVVRVTKVDDSGPMLNVTVTVTVPGAGCYYTKDKASQPYVITAIPVSEKQVNFNIRQHNAAPCSS